jgi:hypothetical protein
MIYLLLLLSVLMVRMLAGYDSRYLRGKYVVVKNKALQVLLLDGMSIYGHTRRRKSDRNKMSVTGLWLYAALGAVILVNLICLVLPDIEIAPWIIDTGEFIVYANTLNDQVSAIAVLLLFAAEIALISLVILRLTKDTEPKWIKWLVWGIAGIMLLVALTMAVYLLWTLLSAFGRAYT